MSAAATTLPLSMFAGWLAAGERGLSSEAIVSRLTGSRVGFGGDSWGDHYSHPYDPADFRRCVLLLEAVPLSRLVFRGEMASATPVWGRLVAAWDEILAELEAEVPNFRDRRCRESAPRTYMLMKRVIAGGEKCEPCDGSGKAEACPKCKGSGRRAGGRCRADGCASGYRYCRTCRGRGFSGGVA